jgi:RimJ/RimL family protein N-acetyltransferase
MDSDKNKDISRALKTDPLAGRWYSLVPISPKYHPALLALTYKEQNNYRWRYRGAIPSAAAFEQSLYSGVLIQFAVVPKGSPDRLAGHLVAYNASPQDGHCYIGAVMDPNEGVGTVESIALFLRYLFRHWPFRKIYLESAEFNVIQFASAARSGLLVEEGRLKDHLYFDDSFWDQIVYAIYRDSADSYAERFSSIFMDGAHWSGSGK